MRALRMLLLIVLCLGIAWGLRLYWEYRELHPSTDDAYVQAHIVDIAARVSGPVVAVHVAENDYVEAGDLLFEIDPATFAAAVASARARYDMAAQDTGASDAEVSVARSTLDERKVALARARRNLERATALAEAKLIAEVDFDDATATFAEAEAAVDSARADLRRAESEFGARGDQNARVRAAAAALTAAELELSFTRVVAPVSGWISNCDLREGAMVIAERPQFSIVQDGQWWVEANFKETELEHMHPGQRARITLDMYPDVELGGEVESLGAGSGAEFSLLPPENATGNWVKVTQRFPVRIHIAPRHDDPDGVRPLRVGASATVTVDVAP
ncbi:MAG: HlyD family secretion protein [Gammaproteobacteria bacterium]